MSMKLIRLLANLGYGSRKQVTAMFREGRVTDSLGNVLYANDDVTHADIRVDDEPLDPPVGLTLMLNKPIGLTCSHKDSGRVVHELLPSRWRLRKPVLSTVGRLDRDTSGLLLFTDDGMLLHRIIAPRARVAKTYAAILASDLRGDESGIFASGSLLLESETVPLAPAQLEVLDPRHVHLTLVEGRYHQVRRMFAAVGNHVHTLQRIRVGGLQLGDLAEGQWRVLDTTDIDHIFA